MAISDGVPAISSLKVGFGGFSPTAFDDVENTKKQVMDAENALKRMYEISRRKRELEWGRASKPKEYRGPDGTVWTHVIVEERFSRIVGCKPGGAVLHVPSEIEGFPVLGLADDACSRLDDVQEIVCPDTIEVIGSCAFRYCPKLKRVVFPENVADFSGSWLSHCPSMQEIVLPGGLEVIRSEVFDNEGLKRLRIGRNVRAIVPGAFEKTNLDVLEVDPENRHLHTDGVALYTADGSVLVALGKPVSHYDIAEGCVKVAKKAFCNIGALRSVSLPASLEVLGKFAFAHSGVEKVEVPGTVRVIGEKAFYYCRGLREVALHEGLARIDDSAFEESSLESLRIPASIQHIGASVIARTNVKASGADATISIAEGSESLFLDGSGGLYRNEGDCVHLIQLIDPDITVFHAHPQTRVVGERAFALHDCIQQASFSEGLREVRKGAFRVCSRLARVDLPDTVRVIGEESFLDTQLQSLRVPAELEELGQNALVTLGAHRLGAPPALQHVEVAPGNARFFVEAGMLCERTPKGVRVIVFTGEEPDVDLSGDVTSIAPYAFGNARNVRTLRIPSSLKTIGIGGLSVWSLVELIHVELPKPLEGRCEFDFHFPATSRSLHSISLALGGSSWVNVPDIMAQYDNCIANAHDYRRGGGQDSISVYEQITRVIARLRDPVLLTSVNRNMFNRLVHEHLEEICVDIARHDDRVAMDALLEFGYLNEENLEQVIGAVGRLQDAAMTAYLLEVKRRRFNRRAFDYDL